MDGSETTRGIPQTSRLGSARSALAHEKSKVCELALFTFLVCELFTFLIFATQQSGPEWGTKDPALSRSLEILISQWLPSPPASSCSL